MQYLAHTNTFHNAVYNECQSPCTLPLTNSLLVYTDVCGFFVTLVVTILIVVHVN